MPLPSSVDNYSLEYLINDLLSDLDADFKRSIRMKVIEQTGAGSIVTGRKAVASAGTAEQFTATSTECYKVVICADLGNTSPVVVGDSSVVAADDSQQGIVLVPANNPVTIEVNNVNKLYVDAQTNGDAVSYTYFVAA